MTNVLLISEVSVKNILNISDNVAGKFIQPSIREAQNVALRQIIGSSLLDTLTDMVAADDLTGDYQALVELDAFQYFLAYSAVVELIPRVSYKIGNFGMAKSNDENLYIAGESEISRQIYFYQTKADHYCKMLQEWLLENASLFPELDECSCRRMRAHLDTAANCGIFTGGQRGKILPRGGCGR